MKFETYSVDDSKKVSGESMRMESWAALNQIKRAQVSHDCLMSLFGRRCPSRTQHITNRGHRWASTLPDVGGIPCWPPAGDHVSVWNKDGAPYAFVYHPYQFDEQHREDLKTLCSRFGLDYHVGSKRESWYYPGSSFIVAITRRATPISLACPVFENVDPLLAGEHRAYRASIWASANGLVQKKPAPHKDYCLFQLGERKTACASHQPRTDDQAATWLSCGLSIVEHVTVWSTRKDGPAAVLVAQPYDLPEEYIAVLSEECRRLGLNLYVGGASESWHCPGESHMIVVSRKEPAL